MRIISWNCNGALRKKLEPLINLKGDIYVIQECENPNHTKDLAYKDWAKNFIWTGINSNKGLGVFCREHITLWDNDWANNDSKYFISAKIDDSFNLIAVWNQRNESHTFRYIGQFWKYLQVNKEKMIDSFIIGDFNSNKIWDEKHRICNHSDVIRELGEIGIRSVYHEFYKCEQGNEEIPTFYLQKNLNKMYHIDFAFANQIILKKLKNISIGSNDEWLQISDHMPIIIDF